MRGHHGRRAAAGVLAPATLTYLGADTITPDAAVFTFSSKTLGSVPAAGETRIIIVSVCSFTTSPPKTLDSVTIAGISATPAVQQATTAVVNDLWYAEIPTGTSGDIVVTFSGGMSRCGIGWWRGIVSSSTPTDTLEASASDPVSGTIDVRAGGICVAGATTHVGTTATWTAGLTEAFDQIVDGGECHSGAGDEFATTQSALTVTADFASAGSVQFLSGAAWR